VLEGGRERFLVMRRPIHHNLLHMPDDRAVVVCDENDVDPRPEASLPVPDGQSDAGGFIYQPPNVAARVWVASFQGKRGGKILPFNF